MENKQKNVSCVSVWTPKEEQKGARTDFDELQTKSSKAKQNMKERPKKKK